MRPGRAPGPSGTAPRSLNPTLSGGRGASREQAAAGPWEGEVPSGKAPWGAGWGLPARPSLSLPASPHPRPRSPLDGGSTPGTATVLVRVIIINIDDYAEHCGQTSTTSPCSDDDDDDSWRLHNPPSRKRGRQRGPRDGLLAAGLPSGGWCHLCQLPAAAVASPLGPPVLGLPSSNKLFLLVPLCHSSG